MIKFDYVKNTPVIRDGIKTIGDADYDNWWMTQSVLNSKWVTYGDKAIMAVRGAGAGSVTGISILRADLTDDLADPLSWEILHKTAPGVSSIDMDLPHGLYPAPTSAIDLVIDTSVTTGGFDRLWASFKNKITNLDRSDYSEWDQTSIAGGAIGAKFLPGFQIAWIEQIQMKNDAGTTLTEGTDYQVNNEGHLTLDAEVEWLTDQSSQSNMTFKFVQSAFRYSFYSDDGGQTWTYYGPFLTSAGRPETFGQCALFNYDAGGGYEWHMTTSNSPANVGTAFNYMRSTGYSGGSWTWTDDTKVADLGAAGDWNSTCAIGTSALLEGGYIYLFGTCGSGADFDFGLDATVVLDETLAANNDAHSDYPTALGIWRCLVGDMTTPASWVEYSQNPVFMRSSIGESASGGIWNASMLAQADGYLMTHEAVGMVQGPLSQPQAEATRDYQYGVSHSFLRLPKQTEYNSGSFTVFLKINATELAGTIAARGPDRFAERTTTNDGGDFYITLMDDGSVEVVYFKDGASGTLERSIRSASGLVTAGSAVTICVTMDSSAVKLYVGSDASVVSGLGASTTASDKVLTFGSGGDSVKDFYGEVWILKLFDAVVVHSVADAATTSGANVVGYYGFAAYTTGTGTSTAPTHPTSDDTKTVGTAYDIELWGPVKKVSGQSRVSLPGSGTSYTDGNIGSQQHQARYVGAGFTTDWDVDDLPDASTITIKNARTGMYLGAAGVMSATAYNWTVDLGSGFWRISNGTKLLTTNDRFGPATSLAVATEKTDFTSPYLRYDQQHWHIIPATGGTYKIQNRACGRMIVHGGLGSEMRGWSDAYEERWFIEIPG